MKYAGQPVEGAIVGQEQEGKAPQQRDLKEVVNQAIVAKCAAEPVVQASLEPLGSHRGVDQGEPAEIETAQKDEG